ncbi:uncharacterized protein [Nicotiana sylvestris]|uniref:Uncharacterized protein LOC104241826 n=1 Tax=Nicotiana sylvestris TaxID=4096 RepID=A0A1U7XZK4_NICSY|nr:PREDICTED: uncharacterized protein LOC104241826 [Nicotiana sylvestris]
MVSLEVASRSDEPTSSPRISFSSEFLDEKNFISITPNAQAEKERKDQQERARSAADFEFLSSKLTSEKMITADELFFEGKLRPYWQMHYADKLNKISLKTEHAEEETMKEAEVKSKEESRPINWFIDEDPSPRPPKCTVLWKELLRLKQKRASSLSPSSSTSSSSSSSSSIADISVAEHEKSKGQGIKEKNVKRIKKGLERSRSATLRVRPVIHMPLCTQGKNTALPPLFSLKKGRALER